MKTLTIEETAKSLCVPLVAVRHFIAKGHLDKQLDHAKQEWVIPQNMLETLKKKKEYIKSVKEALDNVTKQSVQRYLKEHPLEQAVMIKLSAQKETPLELSTEMGISLDKISKTYQRAELLYLAAWDKHPNVRWWEGLPEPVWNKIKGFGYQSKDTLKKDLEAGKFDPDIKSRFHVDGIGNKAHRIMCEWAGVDMTIYDSSELQTKIDDAISLLQQQGYTVKKKASRAKKKR